MKKLKNNIFKGSIFLNRQVLYIYPILLILIFALVFFNKRKAEARRKLEKERVFNQALELSNMEMYDEVVGLLKRQRGDYERRSLILYLNALIEEKSYRQAYSLWKKHLSKEVQPLQILIEKLIENNKKSQAFNILTESAHLMDSDQADTLYSECLSEIREFKIKEIFHAGWYFADLGIIEDQKGYYLIDAESNPIDRNRYESLHVAEDGFYAMKNGGWLKLDKGGKFQRLLEEDPGLKKNKLPVNESHLLVPYEEGGRFGYKYKDNKITDAIYEFTSPVSGSGLAFAFSQGDWYKLSFIALRKGRI